MNHELPPLNALRAFDVAAELGSISQAGDRLHVTHGAVSRQIRVLEEQLGLRLFERQGRGVRLTAAGHQLHQACSEAFGRLQDCCDALRRQQQDAPLVLACSGSLLARWFIPRLDRLQRELPELHVQLVVSDSEQAPQQGSDATLAFIEPPGPAGMHCWPLAAERIGAVLSPRHPRAASLCRQAPAALLDEPLLHTRSRPQAWPQWAALQGLDAGRLHQGQQFEHLYYLLEAAHAGLGIAIAPQLLVQDDLAAGRLLAPWGFVETGAQLTLYSPQRQAGDRCQQLADWLAGQLREPPG